MKYRISLLLSLALLLVSSMLKAEELKDFIPSANELAGFKITKKPKYYNQGNLWNYINGAAPGYLAYGFQGMVTFIVMYQKTQVEMITDIYDMGNSLNAFGIYSIERGPEGSTEEFGGGSFQSENTLYFWQDRYYVKLMAYDITQKTGKSLSLLAHIITQKIPKKGRIPHLFSIFPEKGQLERTERYMSRDILGQDYFTNGYSIEYDQYDNKYQILLIQGENTKKTKENFKKYLTFKSTLGQVTYEHSTIGEQAFVGIDNFYGTVLLARKEAYIIGVLGLNNQEIAQEIINAMFSRLTHIIGG